MLHHEEEPENVGAAQVRVTAEEFARAVARHQARREEAAQKLEGTVSLGDAVRELNIDITPEELLAEVQAARAEAQAVHAVPQARRRPRWGLFAASAGLLAALAVSLYGLRQAVAPLPADVQMSAATLSTVIPITAPDTILVQDNSGKSPVLRTLQEIPNGVPVHCSLTQTDGHASLADFSNPSTAWTVIKYNGQVYVRGWIANMSRQAMHAGNVTLARRKELVSGAAPRPVSLALSGIQCIPAQGNDEMIIAQKVQPDGHFDDRW